jgi:hypothetical protein
MTIFFIIFYYTSFFAEKNQSLANKLASASTGKEAREISPDFIRSRLSDLGKEFDKVYKEQFEAAQTVTRNKSDARKLAQEKTLKEFEMQQQATLDRERMLNQIKVAGIGQTREYNEQARINKITSLKQQARKLDATDTKAAAELRAQAADLEMAAGRGAASAVAGDRQELAELKALLKSAEETASNPMLPKAARDAAVAQMNQINQQITGMTKMGSGIGTGAPPSGKVPPPPPGFKAN